MVTHLLQAAGFTSRPALWLLGAEWRAKKKKKLNRIHVLKDAMHGDGKEVPVHEMYGALDRLPDEWQSTL